MGTYVIYADILLLLNFCLDFLLLWAAGRFLRRQGRTLRLLAAALLGAVYGTAIVIPELALLFSPPAAVLVSLLLLRVAYPYQSAGAFLRLTGVFYLVAFAMAGAVLAMAELMRQSGLSFGAAETVRAGALIAALPVAMIVARRGYAAIKRGWQKEDFRLNIEISVAGHNCLLNALIDTGNHLREPLSGRPVIVADYRGLETLLPLRLRDACRSWPDQPDRVLQAMAGNDSDGWSRRLRLVPFASIGKRHGMLLSFKPDSVTLYQQEGKRSIREVMVAVAPRGFGRDVQYQAVLNPDLFAETERIQEVSA